MDIKDSNFEKSIVSEAIGESANIDATGTTYIENNSSGNVFNQCVVQTGAGWDLLNKAQGKYLGEAQSLILKGETEEAISKLEYLFDPSSFEHLSEDIKFRAITLYCDSLFFENRADEALQKLSTFAPKIQSDYRYRGWLYLLQFVEGNEGAIDLLEALFAQNEDSPLLTHLCLLTGSTGLRAKAEALILEKVEKLNLIDLQVLRRSIITLIFLKSSEGDNRTALNLLKKIKSTDSVERYKLAALELSIETQILLEKSYFSSGYHVTVSEWEKLERIIEGCDRVTAAADKNSHIFLEPLELKSLALSLQKKTTLAIDVIPEHLQLHLSEHGVANRINQYQSLGDWSGLERFINRLDGDVRQNHKPALVLALLNQEKFQEAESLSCGDDLLESIVSEFSDGGQAIADLETLANSKEGFFAAAQMAAKRFSESQDNNALHWLVEFEPKNLFEEFVIAEALLKSGETDGSFNRLDRIFTDLEPGVGGMFVAYLRMLQERHLRAKANTLINLVPEKIVFENEGLLNFYINHIRETAGLDSTLEVVRKAHTKFPYLSSKLFMLQILLVMGRFDEVKQLVNEWGCQVDGKPEHFARYLAIVGRYVSQEDAMPLIYELVLLNAGNIEILQSCFAFLMGLVMEGKPTYEEPPEIVECPCFVVLNLGRRSESILIDNVDSPLCISDSDEAVSDALGKKLNEKCAYQGQSARIENIQSKYTWLRHHCFKELSKRPKKTSVQIIEGDTDEQVKQILHYSDEYQKSYEALAANVISGRVPMLCLLANNDGNPVEAWHKFVEHNHSSVLNIPVSLDTNIGSSLDKRQILLDCTSLTNLFIVAGIIGVTDVPGYEFYVVPSLILSVRELANNELSRYGEKLSNSAGAVINLVDRGVIKELPSIPKDDPPEEARKIIPLLDETTKDSLLACYGNENIILCSDDPILAGFASSLETTCVNSYQLLTRSVYSASSVDELERLDAIFRIAQGPIKPNAITGGMVLSLARGRHDIEACQSCMSALGMRFEANKENVLFLIDMYITWFYEREKFPNLGAVMDLFSEFFSIDNISSREWLKLIVHTSGNPETERSALVLLKVFSLFFKLEFYGPFSHVGWFFELRRALNV